MDTSAAFSRHHAPGTRRRAPRPGVGRPECSQRRTTRRARSEACGRVCRICSCLRTTRRSLPAHMLRFNLANGKSFLKTSDACNNPESQSLGDRQQSVYDRYPIHSKSLDSEDPLVKKTSGPHRLSRHGPCLWRACLSSAMPDELASQPVCADGRKEQCTADQQNRDYQAGWPHVLVPACENLCCAVPSGAASNTRHKPS